MCAYFRVALGTFCFETYVAIILFNKVVNDCFISNFLLFIIMDPIGNASLFLSILKNIAPEA